MTSLLTSLYDSPPASGPDYCLELICLDELCFLFFLFFVYCILNYWKCAPWQSGPSSWSSWLESSQDAASLFVAFLVFGGGNCVLALTSSMGFILENLCFALGLRVVFFQKWAMECIRGNREASLCSWFAPLHVPISAQVPRDAASSAFAFKSI